MPIGKSILSVSITVIAPLFCVQSMAQQLATNMSLSEAVNLKKSQYMSYQQNRFAVEDPAGDLTLARLLSNFPFDALQIKLGSKQISVPQETMSTDEASQFCRQQNILDHTCKEQGYVSRNDQVHPEPFVEGTLEPLKDAQLLKAFVRVIQEEKNRSNISPIISEAPRWSDEFLSRFTNKNNYGASNPEDYGYVVDLFDKPLVALFFGSTSKFMTTNKEAELTRWILSQPIRSVTLIDVFRKAYQLHRGDLHHALLLSENIFSRRWRHAHREDLQMTRRLRPFTNWKNGNVNDNFGSWYHFWGVAYYGLIAGKDRALWAAEVEHQGSVFLGSDAYEKQEHFVNLQGARLGGDLREAILSGRWSQIQTTADDTAETSYRNYQISYP